MSDKNKNIITLRPFSEYWRRAGSYTYPEPQNIEYELNKDDKFEIKRKRRSDD